MKKRVIWKMLLLTIVTLGIYRLYWFVKTRREMMTKDSSIKILTPWLLVLPVVMIIGTLIYFVASSISSAASLPSYCHTVSGSYQTTQTLPAECTLHPSVLPFVLFYIAIFVFWPIMAVWLWGYSKGVEKITHEKTSFAMAMIVLLLVPDGIDILIIQDGFNKLPA
jgi:uncharacterized membrane protein YjgN (DUF898 family)